MTAPAGGTEGQPPGGRPADDLLKGRYRLLHRLAADPRTDLWTARDEVLDRTVLVKLLHLDPTDLVVRERFRSETLAVARLSHPGIVAVYDTLLEAGVTGLVLEHVEATPLSRYLHEGGPIALGEALSIALQVADALAVAHDLGVRHCNLSPDSVWLCGDGRVKITDFGTTWADRGTAVDDPPDAAWAQEQADIRALAAVLRDCVVSGGAPSALPDELAALVAEAEPHRDRGRFDTIAETRAVLAAARGVSAAAGSPPVEFAAPGPLGDAAAADPAPPTAAPEPPPDRQARRRRRPRLLAAAAIVAGVAAAVMVPALTGDDPPAADPLPPDPPATTIGSAETPPATDQASLAADAPVENLAEADEPARPDRETPTPQADEPVPPADPGVAIVDVQVVTFRQQAPTGDDPDALRALDGDPSTHWATAGLSAGDNTVAGVGLEFRLAEPTIVSQLVVTSDTVGWEAAAFVGEGGHDRLSGWGPLVDQQSNATGRMVLGLADQQASAVLLWIPDPRAALTDEIRIAEVIISGVLDPAVR